MAASLRTRTSTSSTQAPVFCQWPIVGVTLTAHSSSSPLRRQSTSTSNTWLSDGFRRAWMWCNRWESWAPREANLQKSLLSQTVDSFSFSNVYKKIQSLLQFTELKTLDNNLFLIHNNQASENDTPVLGLLTRLSSKKTCTPPHSLR